MKLPSNFSDPFGLDCVDKDGNRRPCNVTWSKPDRPNPDVTPETMAEIQALADEAELDLVLSSGRRPGACTATSSLHRCGRAVDISGVVIDGSLVDFGQGLGPGAVNVNALSYIGRLQGLASGRPNISQNLGPMGLWSSNARGTPMTAWYNSTRQNEHYNHVHLGVHP